MDENACFKYGKPNYRASEYYSAPLATAPEPKKLDARIDSAKRARFKDDTESRYITDERLYKRLKN